MDENQLSIEHSIYARSILQKMKEKGEDKVVNRDEILIRFWEDNYRSVDFGIDAAFEYIVLCAMVVLGEIEIDYPGGKNINALGIKDTIDIPKDFVYTFSHIRRPIQASKRADTSSGPATPCDGGAPLPPNSLQAATTTGSDIFVAEPHPM